MKNKPLTAKERAEILRKVGKHVASATDAAQHAQSITQEKMQKTNVPGLERLAISNAAYDCRELAAWMSILVQGGWL